MARGTVLKTNVFSMDGWYRIFQRVEGEVARAMFIRYSLQSGKHDSPG